MADAIPTPEPDEEPEMTREAMLKNGWGDHPFTSGELVLHHRYEGVRSITCGVQHGCVTPLVDEVRCPNCIAALQAETQALAPMP